MIAGLGRFTVEGIGYPLQYSWPSLVAQLVKNLPALQEMWVRYLGWEDPLEKGIGYPLKYSWASLVTQLVMNPPAMQETWVRPLGWEDPLERERFPTPVFWPGEFHGLYSPWDHNESDMTEPLSFHFLSLFRRQD